MIRCALVSFKWVIMFFGVMLITLAIFSYENAVPLNSVKKTIFEVLDPSLNC